MQISIALKHCSGGSSETSSYNSESNDDEEIALAIQAAEIASRKEARSRFRSSSDLIHRLFVCISGKDKNNVDFEVTMTLGKSLTHIRLPLCVHCSSGLCVLPSRIEINQAAFTWQLTVHVSCVLLVMVNN